MVRLLDTRMLMARLLESTRLASSLRIIQTWMMILKTLIPTKTLKEWMILKRRRKIPTWILKWMILIPKNLIQKKKC